MVDKYTSIGGKRLNFPDTVWGDVLSAKDRDSDDYSGKVNHLIALYWKPVYKFIRVVWHKSNDEAKDLTQEFFAVFLEKNWLDMVSPEKGKFRTFVKTVLRHFLIDQKRKKTAVKRGAGRIPVGFDDLESDDLAGDESVDPADYFDREWAREVLKRSIEKMRQKLIKEERYKYLEAFKLFNEEGMKYADIADKIRAKPTDVKNYLTSARKLLKNIIEDEIAGYVSSPKQIEEELGFILSAKF